MVDSLIQKIAQKLALCGCVQGVVLGGSRATGTATESSDIDIGVYYRDLRPNFQKLNEIARELDDAHRENLICREGEWGSWVNCGGWLVVEGYRVDLIFRDIARVERSVAETETGKFSCHYQPGHPHAYLDVMYRGELACCKVLLSKGEAFFTLKQQAEAYPKALRQALIGFFLFEADFSCSLAESYYTDSDRYYLAGQLFRAVSALNQVLFAVNRVYCLNEKKAVLRIESFFKSPEHYRERINQIFLIGGRPAEETVKLLKQLCEEVRQIAED